MPEATMIMYEEEYQQVKTVLSKLRTDTISRGTCAEQRAAGKAVP